MVKPPQLGQLYGNSPPYISKLIKEVDTITDTPIYGFLRRRPVMPQRLLYIEHLRPKVTL